MHMYISREREISSMCCMEEEGHQGIFRNDLHSVLVRWLLEMGWHWTYKSMRHMEHLTCQPFMQCYIGGWCLRHSGLRLCMLSSGMARLSTVNTKPIVMSLLIFQPKLSFDIIMHSNVLQFFSSIFLSTVVRNSPWINLCYRRMLWLVCGWC